MTDYTLVDDYGRTLRFTGAKLVSETTDTEDGCKPQWTDLTIWRTQAGQYIVQREVCYRVRHLSPTCHRAQRDGGSLQRASATDTFPCPNCNPAGVLEPGVGQGQVSRTYVAVHKTHQALIDSLATVNGQTGALHHSQFAQAVLAELSDQDPAVAECWMTVDIA